MLGTIYSSTHFANSKLLQSQRSAKENDFKTFFFSTAGPKAKRFNLDRLLVYNCCTSTLEMWYDAFLFLLMHILPGIHQWLGLGSSLLCCADKTTSLWPHHNPTTKKYVYLVRPNHQGTVPRWIIKSVLIGFGINLFTVFKWSRNKIHLTLAGLSSEIWLYFLLYGPFWRSVHRRFQLQHPSDRGWCCFPYSRSWAPPGWHSESIIIIVVLDICASCYTDVFN